MILTGCNSDEGEDSLCLEGFGTLNVYPVEVSAFDQIALFGPVNLKIKQGEVQDVSVLAEPEIFEYVSYEVNDGRLEIGIKENISCFFTEVGVVIEITVPDLEALFVVGASEVSSIGDLELDDLRIDATGLAVLDLSGTVDNLVLDASGEMQLRGFDLVSQEVRITVSGRANVEITCEDTLTITVLGSATIKYKGTPVINENGAGMVTIINSN